MLHLKVGYSKIEICGRQYYMVHIRSNKASCWILSCSFLSSPVLVWSSAGVAHADVLVACLAVLCCWYWNVVHWLIGAFGWIRAHIRFLHTPASILFLQRRIKSSNANVPVQLAVIAITEPRPYLTDLSSLSNIFFFTNSFWQITFWCFSDTSSVFHLFTKWKHSVSFETCLCPFVCSKTHIPRKYFVSTSVCFVDL